MYLNAIKIQIFHIIMKQKNSMGDQEAFKKLLSDLKKMTPRSIRNLDPVSVIQFVSKIELLDERERNSYQWQIQFLQQRGRNILSKQSKNSEIQKYNQQICAKPQIRQSIQSKQNLEKLKQNKIAGSAGLLKKTETRKQSSSSWVFQGLSQGWEVSKKPDQLHSQPQQQQSLLSSDIQELAVTNIEQKKKN